MVEQHLHISILHSPILHLGWWSKRFRPQNTSFPKSSLEINVSSPIINCWRGLTYLAIFGQLMRMTGCVPSHTVARGLWHVTWVSNKCHLTLSFAHLSTQAVWPTQITRNSPTNADGLSLRHDICQKNYATAVLGARIVRKKRVNRDIS